VYWEQTVTYAVETHVGLRRKNNEDASSVHICTDFEEWSRTGHLLIVADGMGGHAVGELASGMAVETIPHTFLKSTENHPRKGINDAIVAANTAIHTRGTQNQDFLHMGTTCTSLVLGPHGAVVGHVGDSRAYRVRRDRIDQLTFDHSVEWELERKHGDLKGVIDLSAHRNVITRSLGPEENVEVDVEGPYPVFPGDTFLLCSDGLSNQVTDEEIGSIVRELSPKLAAQLLIHLANVRGGPDNSTVIVARAGDLPANVTPIAVEEPVDQSTSLDWSYLIGFWVASMVLVAGLSMTIFGRPLAGSFVAAVAAIGLIILLFAAVKKQRVLIRENVDTSKTNLWRPHRTAVVLSSKEMCQRLIEIDVELERSAREDGWSIQWEEHNDAVAAAHGSIKDKRYGRALRHLARAIDSIMRKFPRATAAN